MLGHRNRQAYTLVEVVMVVALLLAIVSFAAPSLIRDIEGRRLPESARRMRSLLTLTRANAMYDGKRYRIRFPAEDELDSDGGDRQPIVEREDEPFADPGVYNRVTEPWARGDTFLDDIWCAGVRLGRPTLERIMEERFVDELAEELVDEFDEQASEYEEQYPPLYIEPDGTTEWVTFVVTNAPRDIEIDELIEDEEVSEQHQRIEVIFDGNTGLCWLQRPFYDEELDMFQEHGWPPVLRKDFIRTEELTEEEVLEIRETRVR